MENETVTLVGRWGTDVTEKVFQSVCKCIHANIFTSLEEQFRKCMRKGVLSVYANKTWD